MPDAGRRTTGSNTPRRAPATRVARQRQVRLLAGEGLGVRAIARRLGVAPSTISRDLATGRPATSPNLKPWPPAPEGNTRALRHGCDSPRLIESRARRLAPEILEANAHLNATRDGLGVLRYAMLLARLERAYDWLAEQGDDLFADVATGAVHALYERIGVWERQASRDEERLAIAPFTRARLGLVKLAAGPELEPVVLEPPADHVERSVRAAELLFKAGVLGALAEPVVDVAEPPPVPPTTGEEGDR